MVGPRSGCGCITSRTGCLLIGWFEVVFLIPFILIGVVALTIGLAGLPAVCPDTSPDDVLSVGNSQSELSKQFCQPENRQILVTVGIVALALSSLYLFAPCCLIHGTSNEKTTFLIPYIVCAVLKIIAWGLSFIGACMSNPVAAVLIAIGIAIEVYKTVVVCCHYNYLTNKPKNDNEMLVNKGAYVNF